MMPVQLAQQLKQAGLAWTPGRGDRFVVPDRDMDDDVFVVSDMAVEVREHPSGQVLGFNGTTEWALDSVERDDVVWLPREDQLRELLGSEFVRLERHDARYEVVLRTPHGELVVGESDVETAYALGLLQVLTSDARSTVRAT